MTTVYKSRKWSLPVLAALATVIWAYNAYQIANGVRVGPLPAPTITSTMAAATSTSQPPSRLRYSGEFRDPFRNGAERRAREVGVASQHAPEVSELETPLEMRLTGIVGGSGILEFSDGQTVVVGPHSKVADYRVLKVGRDLVVLSGPRGSLTLHLE